MATSFISHLFGDLKHTKRGGADSFSDQLSCKYTVYILLLMIVVASTRVYIDEPIVCYCPTEFTDSQVDYANKLCWVSETYSIGDKELPENGVTSGRRINHYQWVTILMAVQAILFYLPRPVWRALNRKSGIAVHAITDTAIDCSLLGDKDQTNRHLEFMTRLTLRILSSVNAACQKKISLSKKISKESWLEIIKLKRNGIYLICAYFFVKFLYLLNAIAQLFIVGAFLNTRYHMFGIYFLQYTFFGGDWKTSQPFPRVTICHFRIKKSGDVQRNTIQCALPMNFFYEAMFIYMWFWICFVIVVTLVSIVLWLYDIMHIQRQISKIEMVLSDQTALKSSDRCSETELFVRQFLHRDGWFVVKLVERSSTKLVTAEFISSLYNEFLNSKDKQKSAGNTDSELSLVISDQSEPDSRCKPISYDSRYNVNKTGPLARFMHSRS